MEAVPRELSDLDAALAGHTEVAESRVLRLADGRRAVVAVPRDYYGGADLRDEIWDRVAGPALPDLLVLLPSLPADASAPVLDAPGAQVLSFARPESPTETVLASCWSDILGRRHVSAGDSFLSLGGDSMSALLLLELVNERLGADVSVDDLLSAPSLGALARSIDKNQ